MGKVLSSGTAIRNTTSFNVVRYNKSNSSCRCSSRIAGEWHVHGGNVYRMEERMKVYIVETCFPDEWCTLEGVFANEKSTKPLVKKLQKKHGIYGVLVTEWTVKK